MAEDSVAFRVFRTFVLNRDSKTSEDVAKAIQTNRSYVIKCLRSLIELGLLEKEENRQGKVLHVRYSLSKQFQCDAGTDLLEMARKTLAEAQIHVVKKKKEPENNSDSKPKKLSPSSLSLVQRLESIERFGTQIAADARSLRREIEKLEEFRLTLASYSGR